MCIFLHDLTALYDGCNSMQESEFLKNALMVPWTLSTSQQPQQQIQTSLDCNNPDLKDKVSWVLFLCHFVKNQSTCIAPCMVLTTLKCSGMDHTGFNLQKTPCLPLHRKRSPDGASTECGGEHLIAAHYSFIDPKKMKG